MWSEWGGGGEEFVIGAGPVGSVVISNEKF